jgi:geranylgeranyl pyrophosphate synthase
VLDFVVTQDQFGKPVNADLCLGLATAPVLYASEQFEELNSLIERNFKYEGDVDKVLFVNEAREMVLNSDGITKTRELASAYCEEAKSNIASLPNSDAKSALLELADAVLTRTK